MSIKVDVMAAIDSAISSGPHPVVFLKSGGMIDTPLPHIHALRTARPAIAELIAREEALRNALEHIAGSCDGRAADVARAAIARAKGETP